MSQFLQAQFWHDQGRSALQARNLAGGVRAFRRSLLLAPHKSAVLEDLYIAAAYADSPIRIAVLRWSHVANPLFIQALRQIVVTDDLELYFANRSIHARKLALLSPDNGNDLSSVARKLLDLGYKEVAAKVILWARCCKPLDEKILFLQGQIAFAAGEFAAAEQHFDAMTTQDERARALIEFWRARIYLAENREDEAEASIKRFLNGPEEYRTRFQILDVSARQRDFGVK